MISIIIPTYNRYGFLMEAVASVMNQTYRGAKEIIVVDDGSVDETRSLIYTLDITYLRAEHSGMPGKVRNIGAAIAEGELLAFLDSDDLFEPEKLRIQARFMEDHPEIGISHTRERWQRNGKTVSQAGQDHNRRGRIFEDALRKCIIGPSTAMMRRDLFLGTGGFREDLEISEDYEYWLRITAFHDVGFIEEPLTIKRAGHGDQLSEKYGRIELFRIRSLMPLVDRGYFTGELLEAATRELVRKIRVYAAGCEKRGRRGEAEEWNDLAKRYEEVKR